MNTPERPGDCPPSPPEGGRERWTRTASTWIRGADTLRAMSREATAVLVDSLGPAPGERIIDLACGAGDPAEALAEAVGPAGLVVGVDRVEAMARSFAERLDGHAGRAAAALAETAALPFDDDVFDGASCRFGLMFVPTPVETLRALRRVVRPGGRCALVTWGAPEDNPYFTLVAHALDEAGAPPAPVEGPTVFECQDPVALEEHLRAAGWEQVRVRRVPLTLHVPVAAADELLPFQRDLSLALEERLAALPDALVREATAAVGRAAARWLTDDGLAVPAEVLLAEGR